MVRLQDERKQEIIRNNNTQKEVSASQCTCSECAIGEAGMVSMHEAGQVSLHAWSLRTGLRSGKTK